MKPSRKHILFLASWYPSRVFLDNGDFIQRHAQTVSILNDVSVVHAIKDPDLKDKNFEISIRERNGLKEVIVYFKPALISPFNLLKLLQAYLIGINQVVTFDIIHINVVYPAGLIGIYLKHKYKKPLILTEHWTDLHVEYFKNLAKYKQLAIRKILNFVDFVLPVSNHLGKSIQKINSSLEYEVIPNVVDFSKFKPIFKKSNSKITFLHLSHLGDQQKNINGILNVSKRLANNGFIFELQIGGNGDLKPIEKFISENNLAETVKTFGRLEHHEVNQKMNEADCFVLFSRYENQPCVQAESFATGLPIITTNVGGINEFLPENFGILIDSENEDQLYQAMIDVIKGKQFEPKKELTAYAKKHFAKEEISKKFDEIYNKLIPPTDE
ncbi:glycosyltransferase [Faecalibacter macacae]|uniref:Glycosyltransferase n=1 Tax=Faecalibacter macacae TaxID=1859289 RepID=A0A3L9M5H9_9FLAO|nr:glycosyltransferase [Faecalibacter macacae]RLZ08295.1 glycosyltransferase [Faecalibacter macacae]